MSHMRILEKKCFEGELISLENYLQNLDTLLKIKNISVSQLPFYGVVELEFINQRRRHTARASGYYIDGLIATVAALDGFLLKKKEPPLEKYYMYKSIFDKDYDLFLYLVNNLEIDGYIYIYIHQLLRSSSCPKNQYGIMGDNGDMPYIGHQQLMDEISKSQKEMESDTNFLETWRKEYGYENITTYYKACPEEFLQDFLPCFEENIYDIPESSIIWQTPLLQETMANFQKLKAYAKEQGWVE